MFSVFHGEIDSDYFMKQLVCIFVRCVLCLSRLLGLVCVLLCFARRSVSVCRSLLVVCLLGFVGVAFISSSNEASSRSSKRLATQAYPFTHTGNAHHACRMSHSAGVMEKQQTQQQSPPPYLELL